jgi:glc operon protein GlcG
MMRYGLILCSFIGAALLAPVLAHAQQQTQTSPDAVPEKQPFVVPYGAPISADEARAVIAAAVAEAKKHGWALNIAVVDSGSNLVAFERMDDAQLASIEISQHKARAAARFRRETKLFEGAVQNGAHYVLGIDGIITAGGGIPLVRDGKIIGAIGCSGAMTSQDEVVCKAGAATVK